MCKDSVSVFVVNLFDNVQPKKNKTKSQRAASLWFLTFAHDLLIQISALPTQSLFS